MVRTMRIRFSCLFVCLSATAAHAAPCQVNLNDPAFDTACLPAVSSDGQTVAVPIIDPDGGRGMPNLTVQLLPTKGGAAERIVVVTADQVMAAEGDLVKALAKANTLQTLNKRLTAGGFSALNKVMAPEPDASPPKYTAQDAGLEMKVAGAKVTVTRGAKTVGTDQFGLPATGKCGGANKPYLSGMWHDNSENPTWLVVQASYRGNDTCNEPPPAFHLVPIASGGTPGGGSAPVADSGGGGANDFEKAATQANDRGMARYREQNWAAAAAEFQSAIEASPNHVKPHYNLACVAAHMNDLSTVIVQLQWLKESKLPEAKSKLVKARTDSDLASVIGTPEVKKILGPQRSRNSRVGHEVTICYGLFPTKLDDFMAVDSAGNVSTRYTFPDGYDYFDTALIDGNLNNGAPGCMFSGLQIEALGDAAGNLYVSNSTAGEILKITPSGTRTTFASGIDRVMGLALA